MLKGVSAFMRTVCVFGEGVSVSKSVCMLLGGCGCVFEGMNVSESL